MNILTITTLYPNSEQNRHGIFVENRLKHLVSKYPGINLTVIAPVPYFPLKSKAFGVYGAYARVPKFENRFGIDIYHPRYLVIPKIGMNLTPSFLYRCIKSFISKLLKQGHKYDLIDAHYFYPDGIAANQLAKELGLPIAITARGNDISLLPNYEKPKAMITKTLVEADACIGVCQALVDEMKVLAPEQKSYFAMRNGVDLEMFTPLSEENRLKKRIELNLNEKFVLISVGHFIERKGHHLVIESLKHIPNAHLLLLGDGELDFQLRKQVKENNLQNSVTFMGAVPQSELSAYYGVADCMVLMSSREGWANVLLESMACGTPVVATPIWGTPEVVSSPDAGLLTKERSVDSLVEALSQLEKNYPSRESVRTYAEKFSWDDTSEKLRNLFQILISRN